MSQSAENPYESPRELDGDTQTNDLVENPIGRELDGDAQTIDMVENPPGTLRGILARLGPGLIIAASIVGSGELIATTKTGAAAGFSLLWLILIGCVIKVFAQVEIGRFTMTEGRTAIEAFDQVPGPRWRVNWLCWYWLFMYAASIAQLGGIVGVVGQSLAISMPLTGDYQAAVEDKQFAARTTDDLTWAAIVTVVTSVMLVVGRYGFVQHVSTVLVAAFTVVSIANLFALQSHAQWAISWDEITAGLSFGLPTGPNGLSTALATFGIIGVGASELVAYPYWCLEKGYARAAGPRDNSAAWGERAWGWFKVLQYDAWCSMGVYTFATVAFYLTGATVLHRIKINPDNDQLIPTLLEMYRPVFGKSAEWIFLFGAFAVLYSTFFVASAGNARVLADGLRVFRCGVRTPIDVQRWTKILCGAIPVVALLIYLANPKPVTLVMISGLAQAVMLPMLGFAALYYRYYRCDVRLRPGLFWTSMLWVSFAGLVITCGWGVYSNWNALYLLLTK